MRREQEKTYEKEKKREKEKETPTTSAESESEELDPEELQYICPIRQTIMRDPVVALDGHTYEREAITEWQLNKGTSPMTREPITASFKPNYALSEQIEKSSKATKEQEQKVKKYKKEVKKTKAERKQDQEDFKLEMRKFMARQDERDAAYMEKFARQEEKMNRLEEEIEHTRHQNAKVAKEYADMYDKQLSKSALTKGFVAAAATTSISTVVGVGIGGGLVAATILTGGFIWVLIGGMVIAVVAGAVVYTAVSEHRRGQDARDYERDKVLIDSTIRAAMASGKMEALGPITNLGQFTLSGLIEAMSYAMVVIGEAVKTRIQGWRQNNTLTHAQQISYLEGVKSTSPVDGTVRADPIHINVKHTYDTGQMPLVCPGSTETRDALNSIITDGNKKLQEGTAEERLIKGSAVYKLATTAVDAGIKAVNDNAEPELGAVYVMAVKIDKGYVTKQTQGDKQKS